VTSSGAKDRVIETKRIRALFLLLNDGGSTRGGKRRKWQRDNLFNQIRSHSETSVSVVSCLGNTGTVPSYSSFAPKNRAGKEAKEVGVALIQY
jgi:hypothetical protein